MCEKCVEYLRRFLNSNRDFETATGKTFRLKNTKGKLIYVTNERGNNRNFHLHHLSSIYHYLKYDAGIVKGVGSGPDSVRSLIGEEGKLAQCPLCERNVAYIWGILHGLPNTVRGRNNALHISEKASKV